MKRVSRNISRTARVRRIRAKISGTASRPRLSVFRSLRGVSVQAIDDVAGKTLAAASWKDLKLKKAKNTVEEAVQVGRLVAERCLGKGVTQAVFDRAGYRYHGKVAAVAEGAREGGLSL